MMPTFRVVLAATALFAISTAACGSQKYEYAPPRTTNGSIVGHAAAEVPFPPDAPHGMVRLATLGVDSDPAQAETRSLHVRMIATNRSSELWTIDGREQQIVIKIADGEPQRDEVRSRTLRASAPPAGMEAPLQIKPGETQSIDLYFPLPRGSRSAREVPEFDAFWTVHDGARPITTRTPFERFSTTNPSAAPGGETP